MGTRHLILVYYRGEYRIAQYGQWDGYPSGQGVTILAFVSNPVNLEKLKAALDTPGKIFTPTDEQLKKYGEEEMTRVSEEHKQGTSRFNPLSIKSGPIYPSLYRDTGAKILELVTEATEPVPIVKEVGFIADTVFCEWAYVIDLDSSMLEVYAGYRSGMVQSRFGEKEGVCSGDGPALVAAWGLHVPPKEHEFMEACERPHQEDE